MKLLITLCLISACIYFVVSHKRKPKVDYCSLKCPLFDPISGAIYLPGPTKRHFYKCSHGVGIMHVCNKKARFNPKLQVCDRPKRAGAVTCKGSPNYVGDGSGDDFWENSHH